MKEFDIAFSMGFSCGGTMALRRAGLQYASYPLDWIGSPGVLCSARMIAAGFANWFEKSELSLVGVRGGSFQNDIYQNRRTRFGYPHDFSRFHKFDEQYPKVAAKYARRVERFMNAVAVAKRALVVYIERPIDSRVADSDLLEARNILASKFPSTLFDLVYFYEKSGCGDFIETGVADGVTSVACDYQKMDHGEISHAIRPDVMAAYFRERFTVADRRTEAEKAEYDAQLRNEKKVRFGGRLNEIKYRIYRRLEKELQEKGIVPRDFPLWFS